MLILTRRIGESIMIGDDVVVTVLGVQGNQVKIGIDAPKSVRVDREEIYRKIQAEKLAAEKSGQMNGDAQPSSNYNAGTRHHHNNSNYNSRPSYNSGGNYSNSQNYNNSNSQNYNNSNSQNYNNRSTQGNNYSGNNNYKPPMSSNYSPSVVGGTDYNDQYAPSKSSKPQPEIIVKKKRILSGEEV